ncbi:MAG: tetratricopeptide repeat protein [Thermoanaerobaculales bacterium]|nr:tetratricopeptide repeat protein [Thermoanaerobaculales bacterium]
MNSKQRMTVLILVLILALPGMASAITKGRLIGKVLDPEGNPISGVTVTATCQEVSNFKKIEITDKKGIFKLKFTHLDVVYDLVFEKAGFHTMNSEQDWSLQGTARDEFTMYPGSDSLVEGLPPASDSNPAIYAFNTGVEAIDARDFETAQEKFKEALAHDPDLHQAWAALSVALLNLGSHQEAAEAAEKAIALGAGGEMVHRSRWEAYRNLGDEAKALEARTELEKAAQLTEDAKRIYNEGVALTKAGDDEGAFAKFQEATDIDPNLRRALFGIATTGLKIDRAEDAMNAAETILNADPKNEEAIRIRFNAALQLRNEEKILDALVGLAAVDPDYARESLWRLAIAADDAGDAERAKKAFAKVLEVDPNHPQAHYYLGLIYVNEGANEEAIRNLERFVELAPDDPDVVTANDLLKFLGES